MIPRNWTLSSGAGGILRVWRERTAALASRVTVGLVLPLPRAGGRGRPNRRVRALPPAPLSRPAPQLDKPAIDYQLWPPTFVLTTPQPNTVSTS